MPPISLTRQAKTSEAFCSTTKKPTEKGTVVNSLSKFISTWYQAEREGTDQGQESSLGEARSLGYPGTPPDTLGRTQSSCLHQKNQSCILSPPLLSHQQKWALSPRDSGLPPTDVNQAVRGCTEHSPLETHALGPPTTGPSTCRPPRAALRL